MQFDVTSLLPHIKFATNFCILSFRGKKSRTWWWQQVWLFIVSSFDFAAIFAILTHVYVLFVVWHWYCRREFITISKVERRCRNGKVLQYFQADSAEQGQGISLVLWRGINLLALEKLGKRLKKTSVQSGYATIVVSHFTNYNACLLSLYY